MKKKRLVLFAFAFHLNQNPFYHILTLQFESPLSIWSFLVLILMLLEVQPVSPAPIHTSCDLDRTKDLTRVLIHETTLLLDTYVSTTQWFCHVVIFSVCYIPYLLHSLLTMHQSPCGIFFFFGWGGSSLLNQKQSHRGKVSLKLR